MKKKLIAAAAAVAVTTTTLGIAGPASASTSGNSIVDVLLSDPADTIGGDEGYDTNPRDFDVLTNAAIALGLVDALNDGAGSLGTLTVFAPTDAAFIQLVDDVNGDQAGPPAEQDVVGALLAFFGADALNDVATVVKYHVVAGRVGVFDVVKTILRNQSVTTVQGESFKPQIRLNPFRIELDDVSSTRLPRIQQVNVGGWLTNGVIHSIDRVLLPTLPSTAP